jgi:integrase
MEAGLSISPSMVTELKAHLVNERRLLIALGRATEDDLLFQRWDGATRSPNWLTQKFALLMASLKIRGVTLHSPRHIPASRLIASGLDILTVSRRLGYGSAAINLGVYGHLIEGKDAQAGRCDGDNIQSTEDGLRTACANFATLWVPNGWQFGRRRAKSPDMPG